MKLLSLLPLVLLIGCPSAPKDSDSTDTGTAPLTDEDGDGFTSDVDCDDTLADVNPDAPEICDGVDNDCDGQIDGASATDASTWYADTDGDGYGGPGLDRPRPPGTLRWPVARFNPFKISVVAGIPTTMHRNAAS
jgi:hypothetical protein